MSAAKKLKEFFFSPPKKVIKMSPSSEKVVEIKPQTKNDTIKYSKQEVEILKYKISRHFQEDPNAAKKAALIIEKMLSSSSKIK